MQEINNNAFIHIIMPVYNVEPYLRDAIDSVLAQTYKNFELILVDDGSPDNCGKICDEYADKYSNIRVIHKENGGLSSARNVGIDAVSGGYISFLDSDDTIAPDTLKNAVEVINLYHSDITMFGMDTVVYEDGNLVARKKSDFEDFCFLTKNEVEKNFNYILKNGMWNYVVEKVYRTELLQKNQVRFESFFDGAVEDAVFLYKLLPYIESFAGTNKIGYQYAIRSGQSCVKSFRVNFFDKNIKRIQRLIQATKQIGQSENEKCNQQIVEMFSNSIIWSYEQLFQKNCNYSILQKVKYIRKTYSNDDLPGDYREKALQTLCSNSQYNQASRFTKCATKHILKKHWCLVELITFLESIYLKVRKLNA
ncbi:MAG: glycosyltransferase family 2 protein [Clostridia bacterium]|nr:glycosyltransferase family 2 protein [Clostridia bacterium]